jgi:GNAT superfamily N-acetyltransferase
MPIRRATAAELSLLLALDGVAKRDSTHRAWLRRAIAERGSWVLVQRGQIVAHGVLRRSFFDRWFVESLYVAASLRRTGCGSRLLDFLEARAEPAGEIWTSTNRSNRPMQQLLRVRGYQRCGRIIRLDPGDPELIFRKRL